MNAVTTQVYFNTVANGLNWVAPSRYPNLMNLLNKLGLKSSLGLRNDGDACLSATDDHMYVMMSGKVVCISRG